MQNNRWVMNRAGLVNFWYYDDEAFDFSKGRLLLRGSNGSGKSVTMQSFVPLLLDGNKSPERLDPFGSRARRIENYLLGDDDNGKDESIGYLYMEFKKKHSNQIATIGMGFKANRGKPLKSWGFSVTDGRRIGKDLFLYKQMGEKIPLTMKELVNRIGDGGHVVEGQKNYMKLVNDLIFGFEDLDEYDELVKLLVQLRSPKLSKDFKPTVIYEIMENSLQPLSEDDLRPMSEAIENMDNIKSRLEELKECKEAADRIKQAFDRYNKFIILDKAKRYHDHKTQLEQQNSLQIKRRKEIDASTKQVDALKETIVNLEIQLQTQQEKKRELEKHDSVLIRDKIIETEEDIGALSAQLTDKDKQHESKRNHERDLDNQIRDYQAQKDGGAADTLKKLDEMETQAESFAFDEHAFMMDEMKKDLSESYNFTYIKNTLKDHTQTLSSGVKALEEEKKSSRDYDTLCLELDKLKKEAAEKEKLLEQANRQLADIQDETIEKLYVSNDTNKEYIISQDGLINLSREIQYFGPTSNFNGISDLLRKEYNRLEAIKAEKLYHEKTEQKIIETERSQKEEEVRHWKNIRDPEPHREEKAVKNREKLTAMKIPFVPLYKAVDYVEGLSQEIQSSIEEAMVDMGILDALIIPKAYREQIKIMEDKRGDKYIFSSPKFMVHSLNQYLKVDTSMHDISAEEVENVLTSILLDENHHTHMDEKGNYSLGILRGKTGGSYTPKFIGATARKKYREDKLFTLGQELEEIQKRLNEKKLDVQTIVNELEILRQEFSDTPGQDDLVTAAEVVRNTAFEHEMCIQELEKKRSAEKVLYELVKKIKEEVYRITRRMTLTLDLEIYREAHEAAVDYREELYELEKPKIKMQHDLGDLAVAENRYEKILEDLDAVLYEINILKTRLSAQNMILNNLNEQLKLTDYEAIKTALEQCLKALKEIPKEKEECIIKREQETGKVQRLTEEFAKSEKNLYLDQKINEILEESFKKELGLGYVVKVQDSDVWVIAKDLISENPVSDKLDKEHYTVKLLEYFNRDSQYLREYAVNIQHIFEEEIDTQEDQALANAVALRKRMNITAKVTGKSVNFYELSAYLHDSFEETQKLLKESDRELFEDILVKNISKKISGRIFHSEKWVDNMNNLMEKMDTSMGLSFSLKWSSKKAESEDQLDTKKLVNLLKMDGNLLRDDDLSALSEHFRSKIELARRTMEDKNVNMTFHSIMKDILDYRKWFEFKLFFKKTGQMSKELTNNGFFKLSGGEKAMAMYVPLFSAVNARYEGAGKDSARIISLDEAFAGVDEQNIRDMFRLLNDLDLSYIINSQILWGDYDTVDSMAISELIRPDNVDFVTVLRYHWNGKVRKLVGNDGP